MSALADHLLGYRIVIGGVESDVRYGPQPYEGLLSVICESFHCPPSIAETQDWSTVHAILDYRTAVWAVEAFNDGAHGMATMQRNPHLLAMLAAMRRAQGDEGAAVESVRAEMEREAEDA